VDGILGTDCLLVCAQLETLHMLTNADLDSASPCTVILLGQPTLRRAIKHGQLAALDQRITVGYHLAGLTETETLTYIRHHLAIAGRGTPLLADDAITLIHQVSRGYPHTINNICRQALLVRAIYRERSRLGLAQVWVADTVRIIRLRDCTIPALERIPGGR
jgi:type II secretory pathway predicted ATPase ExeA